MSLTAALTPGLTFSNPLTTAKLNQVWTNGFVTLEGRAGTAQLGFAAVTKDILAADVAGAALSGGNGAALAVQVDGSGVEIVDNKLQLKNGGITAAKLAETAITSEMLAAKGAALSSDLTTPYEAWTASLTPAAGTVTLLPAHGNLVLIAPTGNITITFGTFLDTGVNRMNVEIWNPNGRTITFSEATIKGLDTPTISITEHSSFFFRRVGNQKWTWRN